MGLLWKDRLRVTVYPTSEEEIRIQCCKGTLSYTECFCIEVYLGVPFWPPSKSFHYFCFTVMIGLQQALV